MSSLYFDDYQIYSNKRAEVNHGTRILADQFSKILNASKYFLGEGSTDLGDGRKVWRLIRVSSCEAQNKHD